MSPAIKARLARLFERLSGSLVIEPDELYLRTSARICGAFFTRFGVDCVFDVGANRGQYATMLREHVGYRGPIVSYEPIPELADELRAVSAGDPDWHIEGLALDREGGPAVFHVMADTQFSSLHAPAADQPDIFAAGNSIARDVTVMRATLAAELPKWRERLGFARPFLKMDTQGNDQGGGARRGATRCKALSACRASWPSASFMTAVRASPNASPPMPHTASNSAPSCRTTPDTSRCWSRSIASCSTARPCRSRVRLVKGRGEPYLSPHRLGPPQGH